MTAENRDYLEITFRSINCFANDGVLDAAELDNLIDIALRDGNIDQNEKRVLSNIIGRLGYADLTSDMLRKVEQLKSEYGI